ncbi:GD11143 [Drosophila simulans]|uniref:GD11143 n=1 Tax=Drosophila simulans TaxID=7240 RepID=B4QGZ5_DROSI|nr:GD11143 [Drosophila simulans]
MWLSLIFIACLAGASSGSLAADEKNPVEKGFVPRYTPVAEGKRQDLNLPTEVGIEQQKRPPAGDKKPWRRVQYGYEGGPTAAWAAPSPPAAILSILNPLLAPGLLLLGVNLGALLYMLLGLLGMAPYRSGSASRLASHPETNSQFWPDDHSFYHPRR